MPNEMLRHAENKLKLNYESEDKQITLKFTIILTRRIFSQTEIQQVFRMKSINEITRSIYQSDYAPDNFPKSATG